MAIANTGYNLTSRLGGRVPGFKTLRMTAMIDVIFLLLIFFLLTAKFRPAEDFLSVNVPAQRTSQSILAVEPLEIFIEQIGENCKVIIASQTLEINSPASRAKLPDMLADVLNLQDRYLSDPVELICSEDVSWQNLVSVYDTLYGTGLTDISFRLVE